MVSDHEAEHPSRWAAILSIAAKICCAGQTLNSWTKKTEVEAGRKSVVKMVMATAVTALERENLDFRQAN